MCDCFHLAFPNWHGSPGTGAARRLKAPEPEDDSVCEEPSEFLEGERPRPQGSSPVNEYPANEKYTDVDKEREEELYDPDQKSSGGKKGRKVGFGSFFEKRSKMSQEEFPESGVIVKTPKKICAEGLVVSGGGKEGIFIKEVKAESPAAKHLSVQEGDQILSATVYFENVSYEDALQILEHAQPYKMELCVKRKPPAASALEERQEVAPGEEEAGPLERGRTKIQRRQDARISWPKFPSFTRGRKAHFKRSHSTSEAEEQRKLEMSPPTSDTESPMRILEPAKDKKTKKQKMNLSKLKMKGGKSKSVEEQDKDSGIPISRSQENVQETQTKELLDINSPQPQEYIIAEPHIHVINQQEKKETIRVRNEYNIPHVSGPVTETSQHKAELISLDKTLKTADISSFLADRGSPSTKKTPEGKKKRRKERSELKVNIQGKEKDDSSPEGLLKSPQAISLKTSTEMLKTPNMEAISQELLDKTVGPKVTMQTELKRSPIAADINAQRTDRNKSISEAEKISLSEKATSTIGDVDIHLPKVDMSIDMSDVGLLQKSPIKLEKQKKERSILIHDSERYGIRTRGPMADTSLTKKYLERGDSNISKPKSPKMKTSLPGVKDKEITATRKDASIRLEAGADIQCPQLEIQALKSPKEKHIAVTEKSGKKAAQKFKMPKIDDTDFNVHEPVIMSDVKTLKGKVDLKSPTGEDRTHKIEPERRKSTTTKQVIKIELLKREDIEIPGMESTDATGNLQTPSMILPETGKKDASVPTTEIQTKKIQAGVKVDRIKDTTSMTFKLPKLDPSALEVHQPISKTDVSAKKVKLDLKADFSQPKTPEGEVKGQDHKIQDFDSTETGINYTSRQVMKTSPTYKIPRIDSPDPYVHEPISMAEVSLSKAKVEIQDSNMEGKLPMSAVYGRMVEISASHAEKGKTKRPNIKLPKREDIEIPGMESSSATGNTHAIAVQLPGIGAKDASDSSMEIHVERFKETITNTNIQKFKLPKMDSDFDVHEQITKKVVNTEKAKSPKQKGKNQVSHAEGKKSKFKIPPMPEYDVSFPRLESDVKLSDDLGKEKETGEIHCRPSSDIQMGAGPGINADIKSQSTDSQIKYIKTPNVAVEHTSEISQPDFEGLRAEMNISELDKDISHTEVTTKVKLDRTQEEKSLAGKQITGIEKSKTAIELQESPEMNAPIIKSPKMILKSSQTETNMSVSKSEISTKTSDFAFKTSSIEIKADISESGGTKEKFQMPHIKLPTLGISQTEEKDKKLDSIIKTEIGSAGLEINTSGISIDENMPKCELPVSRDTPTADITSQCSKMSAPEVNAEMKLENLEYVREESTFKVPRFVEPCTVNGVETDPTAIDIKTSKNQTLNSKVETVATLPAVEMEVPSIEEKVEISDAKEFDMKTKKPKILLPASGFSKHDIDGSHPKEDASNEKLTVDVKGPELDISVSEIQADVKGEQLDTRGSSTTFKLPTVKLPKDCISATEIGTEAAEIKSEIIVPKVKKFGLDPEISDLHFEGMIELNKPTEENEQSKTRQAGIDVSLSAVKDQDAYLKTKSETNNSFRTGTDSNSLDYETAGIPDTELGGEAKFNITHGQIPSFGPSELELKSAEAPGDTSLPSTDVSLKKKDRNIKGHVTIDGTSDDIAKKESTLSGKISGADIRGPSIDAMGTDIKGITADQEQEHRFEPPKFDVSLPKLRGPKMNISKSDTDVDVSLPKITAGAKLPTTEIKRSAINGTLDIPEVDKVHKPSKSFSKPSLTKLDTEATEMEADISNEATFVPEIGLDEDETGPEIESSGIRVSVDSDNCASTNEVKPLTLKMPTIGVTVPTVKAHFPESEAEVEEPEIKPASFNEDIDQHHAGKQGTKFELPKVKKAKMDFPLSASKGIQLEHEILPAKVDISGPQTNIVSMESPVEGSSVGIRTKILVEHEKFTLPQVKSSSFGFSKSEITGPKISGDEHLPLEDISTKPKADISATDTSAAVKSEGMKLQEPSEFEIKGSEVDLEGPDVKADIRCKEAEQEKVGSKLLKCGISLPKVKGPAVDVSASKPDADISLSKVTIDAHLPAVEIEKSLTGGNKGIPETDSKGPDITVKKLSLSKDGFSKANVQAPDIDISLPKEDVILAVAGEKFKEINTVSPDTGGKEDYDISGPPSKLKGTTIQLPKLGITTPKVKAGAPDLSVKISLPEMVALSGKAISDHERMGMETKKPDGTFELPKTKVPTLKGEDMSWEIPKGEYKLPVQDSKVVLQDTEAEVKGLSLEGQVRIPDIEAGTGVEETFMMPHVKLHSVGLTKPEITAPNISGSLQVKSEEIAVKKPNTEFNIPMNVTEPDVNISLPEVLTEAKCPTVKVKGTSVEGHVESPDIDSKDIDRKLKKPMISLPKLGISKPEIIAPKISGSFNLPSVDIGVSKSNAGINIPEMKTEVTATGVKLPEADLTLSGETPALDVTDSQINIKGPEVDIDMKGKGIELEGQGSKFKQPKFGISLPKAKGPAVDISMSKPDVDIALPEVMTEAKFPSVEVEGPSVKEAADLPEVDSKDIDIKVKIPKISFPKFGFSKPEKTAPRTSGSLDLPSVDIGITKPNADIYIPDMSVDVTSTGLKLPEAELTVSGAAPAVDIKDSRIDKKGTEVDTDMKGKGTELEGQGSKFKPPKFGISLPKAKGPAGAISVSKPDVEISLPEVTTEAKISSVEVEGPSVEGPVDLPDVNFTDIDIKVKEPKISFPKFGFSKPEITAPKISGGFHLPSVDIGGTKQSSDISVPDMSVDVTSTGLKLPEADLTESGEAPAVHIEDTSIDIKAPEVDIDMKGKGIDIEGQGSKFKPPKFGISLPKAKGPAVDISVSKPDVDISLPEVTYEAKCPSVEVEGPSLEGAVNLPDLDSKDLDIKVKKPKISFPKFGFSKPEITAPKISGGFHLPSVDIGGTKQSSDINVPDMSVDVTSTGLKLPEADLTVSGEAPAVDIKDSSIDIKAPELDIHMKGKGVEMEREGSTFQLPKFGFSLPKAKGPAVDISVSKPDVDISLPEVTTEAKFPSVEVEGPSLEGAVNLPDLDSKDLDIKVEKPKISFPKFGFSKPEITAPKISGSFHLPSVDIGGTKQSSDINVPDMSVDVTSTGLKLPEADLTVSGEAPAVDIKDSSIDIKAPELDIHMKGKGVEMEREGSTFKLPKFGFSLPKVKGPAVDISVSKPDVDVFLPEVTTEAKCPSVEVEGPSLEGAVDLPDLDSKDLDIKVKKPKISFPKFGFSKPEITAPKISGGFHLPSVDISGTKQSSDINVPDMSVDVTSTGLKLPEADLTVSGEAPAVHIKDSSIDIKAPEVDIDMKGKGIDIEGQGSKFKPPKFGISLPKAKGPAVDISVSKPDVDISLPEVTTEAKFPSVEVEGPSLEGAVDLPDLDSKDLDIKVKKPKISFPKFGFSKPEITAPKISGGFHLPSVDIGGTKQSSDINVPDMSVDVTSTGLKLPEADLTVSGEAPAVDIKDTSIDIKAPELDIHMKGKGVEMEREGSTFKLPKFGFSLPKAKGPAVDISVSKPDVDISLPEVTYEAKCPSVEVEGPSLEGAVDLPDLDSKDLDVKVKKPKISFPKFGFSKPEITAPKISGGFHLPSVDIGGTKQSSDINVPDMSVDVTSTGLKLPEADLTVSGEAPAVDIKDSSIDIKAPELDIHMKGKGVEMEREGSTFKLPKFGFSLPKAKGPAVDISVSKPDVDISLPEVTNEAKFPSVEVEGPSLEGAVDLPDLDSKDSDIKVKKPKISFPKFGFSKPEITAPKISGGFHLPSVDIGGTKQSSDINVPDMSIDVTSTGLKLPEADLTVSGEAPAVDIKDTSIGIKAPELDIHMKGKGVEMEREGSTFKLPKFGFSLPKAKGPAVDISVSKPDVDISLPEVTYEAKCPSVEVEGPSLEGAVDLPDLDSKDLDIKVKKPKISFPKFGFSKPEITAPKISGGFHLPSVDIGGTKQSSDINVPDMSVDVTSTGLTLPEADLTVSGEAPAVDIEDSSIDIKAPELDIHMKGKGVEMEREGSTFKLPKFGFSLPKAKGPAVDISVSKPDVDISLPEVTTEAKFPSVEVEGPSLEGAVDLPDLDSKDLNIKVKKPKISFPKFGFSKPEITAPKISGDFHLPSVDIGGTKQSSDINVPDMSIDVTSTGLKLPEADLTVSGEAPAVDIKDSSIDVKAPELDIHMKGKGVEMEREGSTFKLPKFGFSLPKAKGPAVDISVSKPDVDISLPEVTYEAKCPSVEVEGPSLEGAVDLPDLDSKDLDIKVKKPKITFPKFGFSKPEITAPKISGGFHLPSVDIGGTKQSSDINVPDMSVDVTSTGLTLPEADLTVSGEAPAVDIEDSSIDIKAPELDIHMKGKGVEMEREGSTFKLPKFGFSLPKAKGPAVDISVSKPDVDISLPEVTTEAKFPSVEVEGPSLEGAVDLPDLDSKDLNIKVKKPKISFPKFGFSKPEITAPKISGDFHLPSVDIGGTKQSSDINVPDMSIDVTSTGLKLPEADLTVSGEAPAVDIKDSSIDVKAPELDIHMKGKGVEMEREGSTFKLPKFGFSLPKAKGPAVDISVSKPDVDISLPEVTYEAKCPSVEVEGPSLEGAVDLPDLDSKDLAIKVKKPKITFPKFGFSKPEITAPKISGGFHLPSVDIGGTKQSSDINVPDMSVDVTSTGLTLPEADLTVSGEAPAVDIEDSSIDIKAPELDIHMKGKGVEMEREGSTFKLPKFGFSLPKAKGPAVDISVSKPDVDISLPEVTTEAKFPSVEVEGPSLEGAVDLPDLDSKDLNIKVKKPKISFPKFGFSKPEITAPKISGDFHLPSVDIGGTKQSSDINVPDMSIDVTSTGLKLPEADLTVSGEAPAVDIKDSSIDVKAPELDIHMKGKGVEMEREGSTFKLPKFGFSLPKAKGPAVDISVSKPDVDISLPEVTYEAKCPSVEVEGPSLEGAVDLPDLDSKDLDIKVKKPKITFPKFGFSKPEITAPKISGGFHLPSVDIGGTKQSSDINVPDMSVDVTSTGLKLPEADLTVSGEAPAVDIKDTSIDIKAPELDIHMKGKGVEMEREGSTFKLPKFGFSLPKVKGPAVDISVSKPDVDISLPEVTYEAPSVEVEGPSLEGAVDLPDLDSKDLDIKVKKPKISFPKFGFSKPEITAPKISGGFHLPSVDIGGTKQSSDINVPDMSVDVTSTGLKLPEADLTVSGEAPAVDIEDSSIDIKAPELDIHMKGKGVEMEREGSTFKLPKFGFSLPKAKGPAVDISVSKPHVDISLPEVTTEAKLPSVEVEGPSLEGAVDLPDLDSKDLDIKVKKPKISFPKFGFSKPEITAPKISGGFHLPSVDIGGTKQSSDINVPDMSVDVTSTGLKLPEADLTVSGEAPAVDIEDSSIDIKAPELDIHMKGKGVEMEREGSTFKLPKFGFSLPKAKGPAVDISVSKQDVDISLPEVTTEAKFPSVEVEGPSLEGAVDLPDLDSKDLDIKVKKPKISFPKFGFSKPEITAPKISGGFHLPSVDISGTKQSSDINIPDMSIDVTSTGLKLPEADLTVSGEAPAVDIEDSSIDIKAPELDIHMKGKGVEMEREGSTFKLPKFGFSLPKAKGPAVDISVSKPDVDISLPEVTTEAKFPSVEVEGPSLEGAVDLPDLDSKDLDIKVKKPKISFPKFGFSKPEITAPKISGGFHLPSVDISGTKQSSDINVPDMSIDVTSTGLKLPEADLTVSGEAPAVDIKDTSIDIKAPELDIHMKGKGVEMEREGSTFKLPKFGFSLPKAKGPAVDISVSKPDVDISLPEVTYEAKCPSVEAEGPSLEGAVDLPDLDSKDLDIKVKKPKISFPKFGFSKPEITAPKISGSFNLPSVDIGGTKKSSDINVPDMSVDVTSTGLKLPEADLTVSGEAPAVDIKDSSIDIKAPELDIHMKGKGVEMEREGSTFKLPKFGFSLPKAKGPAVDISVSKPDVDISLPEVTYEAKCPSVEVEGPSLEGAVDLPDLDSKDLDIKVKKPKISFPKFGFSKPEITAPKISGSFNLPSVDIRGTKQSSDINVPDMSVDGTSTGLKLPEADLTVSGEAPAVDIKDSSIDIKAPELDIHMKGKVVEMEREGSTFKLPKFGFSLPKAKGPAVDISVSKPDVDISLPEVTTEAKFPSVEVEGPSLEGAVDLPDLDSKDLDIKVKKPKISFPKFGFSKPEITAPKISGGFHLPSVDIGGTKQSSDINVPDMSVDVTSTGLKLPEADLTVSGEAPAVDIKDSSIDIKAPELDIHMKGKGVEMEREGSTFKLPKFGFSLPKAKGPAVDISVSKPDVDISLPEVTTEAKFPSVEVEGPSLEGAVDLPDLDSKDSDIKVRKPKISFPRFGFSKPEITAPKISGSFHLPSVDIGGTKQSSDINVPDMSFDGASTGLKLPEADLTVSGEAPAVDIKDTSIDIKAPELDIHMKGKGVEMEREGSTFKLPKFGFSLPKAKGPAVDISVSKPDVDFSSPEVTAETVFPAVGVPSVEGAADSKGVDPKDIDAKVKKSRISFPTFGFSKPDVKPPAVDIHLSKGDIYLPAGSIEVRGPESDITAPETQMERDIDISSSPTKFKLPTIKLPKFGITGPNITAQSPDIKADIKSPDIEASERVKVDIRSPSVETDGSSVDMKKSKGQVGLTKMQMSGIDVSLPKDKGEIKAPDMNMSLPEVDAHLPELNVIVEGSKQEIKTDDSEASVNVKVGGSPSRFHLPSFKLPKFGITGSKIKAEIPEVSAEYTQPERQLLSSKVDIKHTGQPVDMEKTEGKFDTATVKVPDISFSPVKAETVEAKLPHVEAEGPSAEEVVGISAMDSKEFDIKVKAPRTSFTKFGFSKPDIKYPDADVNLPTVDSSLTARTVEVKGPKVNIEAPETKTGPEIKEKDMNIIGSPKKFKLPSIKFPTFGVSPPKVITETSSAKINITEDEVETSSGQLKVDANAPNFDIETTKVGIQKIKSEMLKMEAPGIDVSSGEAINIKDADKTGPETEGRRFKLPNLGISFQKSKIPGVDVSESQPDDIFIPEVTVEAQPPRAEIKGSSVKETVDAPEVDSKEVDMKVKKSKISLPKFGFSKQDVKSPEIVANLPKADISCAEGIEVKGPEEEIVACDAEIKTEKKDQDMDIFGSHTKFKFPTFKFPTFGKDTSPKSKVETREVTADITAPEVTTPLKKAEGDVGGFEDEVLSIEIGKSEGTVKLSKLKMTNIDMSLNKDQEPKSKPEDKMSAAVPQIKTDESELEAKGAGLEAMVDISDPESQNPEVEMKGSPSRFKLPTFKMPKFEFSAKKAKTTDIDVGTGIKTSKALFEGTTIEVEQSIKYGTSNVIETDKETGYADEQLKSPTLNLSAIGHVFKGFDLEFNVPTLEEVEDTLASPKKEVAHPEKKEENTEKDSDIKLQDNADPGKIELSAEVSVQGPTITREAEVKEWSKFKFKFPKLGFKESSEQDEKTENVKEKVEEKEKSAEPQQEKENEDMKEKDANTDEGIRFKLPKFGITSPSKTIKDSDRAASQPTEDTDCSKERENEEEDVSMTASVRSSDAFADISSTVVSEQPDPLDECPAKVKVKISEPTASVGISEVKVPTDIIASTARTELILLEHHLPDTVNIPASSEATLTSPDDITQETEGDIHVVTSNIQATPSSEHAKVITKYETRSVQAFSQQKMTVKLGTKPWTIEDSGDGPGEPTEENILVEKHIVEENSGDEKGAVIITKRVTQIAGATSGETIVDDTASAIRKLRDTMHSEKMKFFEGAETSVTVSTCKIEKHTLLTSTEKKSV